MPILRTTLNLLSASVFAALALAGCGMGESSPGLGPTTTTPPGDARVVIEESDIVRRDGPLLYVQNPTTGLNIVDVHDAAQPLLRGRAAVLGRAGELYLHAGYALVVLKSASAACTALPEAKLRGWTKGAELAVVSVRRPEAPRIAARHCIDGTLVATRLVNDTLFVVTTDAKPDGMGATARVTSIDVTEPALPVVLQELPLHGASKEIVVTDSELFVAGWTNGCPFANCGTGSDTRVDIFSIDAQTGMMRRRGNVVVRGEPQGRFHMDAYDTQFRIVTYDRQTQSSRLSVLDVSRIDTPRLVGTLLGLGRGERLYATRFDGDKAYVVTFRQADPLWIISLAEPAQPKLLGQLVVPGWSDFIFPRGDRLLTVGRGAGGTGVQVSLFDVSDPSRPRSLTQLQLGSWGATSEATLDHRAVTIVEPTGAAGGGDSVGGAWPLLVVPYSFGAPGYGCQNDQLVQLIDLTPDMLVQRGAAHQSGTVRRTLGEGGVLLAVSDMEVRAFDVADRDWPTAAGFATVGKADELLCGDAWQEGLPADATTSDRRWFRGCQGAGASPGHLLLALLALLAVRRGPRRKTTSSRSA